MNKQHKWHKEDENKFIKQAFTLWYERFFLQSPSLCKIKYDDEKMYEAWKIAYKMGLAEGIKLFGENQNETT